MKIGNFGKIGFLMCALMASILAGSLLSGCASHSNSGPKTTASVGQQLQDLEKSYKDGIITQKEYEKLKKAIIKNND